MWGGLVNSGTLRKRNLAAVRPVAAPTSAPKPSTTASSISRADRSVRRRTPDASMAAYSYRRRRADAYSPRIAAPAARSAAAAASERNRALASAGPCRWNWAEAAAMELTDRMRTPLASSFGRISGSAPAASHTCWLATDEVAARLQLRVPPVDDNAIRRRGRDPRQCCQCSHLDRRTVQAVAGE